MCVGEREQGWVSAERHAQGSAVIGYLPGGPQGFQPALSQPCPPSSCPHAFSFSQNMTRFHMVLAVYRGCRGRRKETCAPLSRGFYTHALKLNTGPRGHHVMCSFHVLITESKPRNKPLWVVCSVLQWSLLFLLDNECEELGSAAWFLPLCPHCSGSWGVGCECRWNPCPQEHLL